MAITTTARPAADGLRSHRRPDIQGIRALAVLLVVVYHAQVGLHGGFIGVDVFFVVSGFVITGLLQRELEASGTIRLSQFYRRRARRLLPAMAVMSVVTLVSVTLFTSPLGVRQPAAGAAAVSASGFLANGYFYFATGNYFQPGANINPYLHTWSLSVEEQFYIAFPLLLLVAWRWGRRRGTAVTTRVMFVAAVISLAAGIVFSFGWSLSIPHVSSVIGDPGAFAFYGPVSRAWEFLAGVLSALALRRRQLPAQFAPTLGVVGLAVILSSAVLIGGTGRYPGVLAVLPVGGTVCLLLSGTEPSPVTRALSWRPAVRLGDLSYSWYLWHWPAIVLAVAIFGTFPAIPAIAAVCSLVPAALSYRWVERPIHVGTRFASRRASSALIVVCIVAPVAAGAALLSANAHNFGHSDIAAIQALIAPEHADLAAGCASVEPLGSAARPPCLWTVPNPHGTVLLIGDSNAGQLVEPMIAATQALGLNLEVATDGGCPFLAMTEYIDDSCRRFVQGSLATLARPSSDYAAIVISNATSYPFGPFAANFSRASPPGATGDPAVAGFGLAVGDTAERASTAGPVVVIGGIPPYLDVPQCVIPSLLWSAPSGCGRMVQGSVALTKHLDLIAAERDAGRRAASTFYDTADHLCTPGNGCSVYVHGKFAYRDGAHLSVSGSMLFESDLQTLLASVAHTS